MTVQQRCCVVAMAAMAFAVPAGAQLAIQGEDASAKFGILGQFWGDWNQDAATGGYAQNLFIRRIRLMASGNIGSNISFFVETDDPKLGMTPKAMGSGFLIQDAFVEWKLSKALRIDGGLMIVPFSRNALQSPASYYSIDLSPLTTVNNSSTQSSALRDAGFEANGFFFNDRLQYRAGIFQGERDANGRDSLRSAGYLQYDFFDRELTYSLPGTALGKKKIVAIDAGFDKQGSYRSQSAGVAIDYPMFGGDEIGGQYQFIHYDGRTKFIGIPDQNDGMVEAAYYLHRIKLQPFMKYESQLFVASSNQAKDVNRYGGGINYYVRGQNLKFTLQYVRAFVNNAAVKPANELAVQIQLFYF